MRHFCHRLRRDRGDHQQIGPFAQAHVGDVGGQRAAAVGLPQIAVDRASGDGLEGQRSHEALRRVRHEHIDLRPGLSQLAGEINGLVGSDAAGHAQHDALVFE